MKVFSPFRDDYTFVTLKSPVKVYYDVAFSCNLRCIFCYVNWKALAAAGEFNGPPIEHIKRILQALKDAEVFDIITLGGDLFSYAHYHDFIRLAAEMGFKVGVISNATQVTTEIAHKLAPYVTNCGVSFRGPDPEIFDATTGIRGAFYAAIHGLKALADAGITISLLYDPLPENYQGLFETVRMLVEDHGLSIAAVQLNRIIPKGRGLENWKRVALPLEAYFALFDQMLCIKEAFDIRVQAGDAFPFCRVPERYWPLLERCEYGVLWGAVTSRGDVKKCSVGEEILGNILKQPLTELWQRNTSLLNYRSFRWTPECIRCPLLKECAGGCSISVPGKHNDGPDYFTPRPVDPEKAAAYKALQLFGDDGHKKSNPLLLHFSPESRPRLKARPRFREDTVGILCVPESNTTVIEQSELPWLVVDELERKVMELCDGNHTVWEINQLLKARFPWVTSASVEECLTALGECGYLVEEASTTVHAMARQHANE